MNTTRLSDLDPGVLRVQRQAASTLSGRLMQLYAGEHLASLAVRRTARGYELRACNMLLTPSEDILRALGADDALLQQLGQEWMALTQATVDSLLTIDAYHWGGGAHCVASLAMHGVALTDGRWMRAALQDGLVVWMAYGPAAVELGRVTGADMVTLLLGRDGWPIIGRRLGVEPVTPTVLERVTEALARERRPAT